MPKSGREGGRECELSLVECLACFMYDLFYDLHILSHLPHRKYSGGREKGMNQKWFED